MIINKPLLKKFSEQAAKIGLPRALRQLLKEVGVPSITQQGDLPQNGPILVISNHIGVFDSPLLLSSIHRDDLYYIALSTHELFGVAMKERLLPIYKTVRLNYKLYEYPLYRQIIGAFPKHFSREEVQKRNRIAISRGARLINQGHAVAIFPSGSVGKRLPNGLWKPGVGYLIKQITNPDTKIVFVRITGTKQRDFAAYLHPFLRKIFFRPQPLSITFSKPYVLRSFIDRNGDAKMITKKIEQYYQQLWK